MLERTLILLKPDAVDRGIIGEIITRFERVGAKIIGMKMLVSEKDTAEQHYTEDLARRRGENVRHLMIAMLTSGPIVVLALEGIDIITIVRKMIGATQPFEAAPGTIRGDYAHISYRYADEKKIGVFNLVHASDSIENANAEIAVWFKPEELVSHKPGYTRMTLREE
ncbi:MAG: Nucleoside-diphosphate kinase [candidate division Kazan bacterium GW2011_GWA1_44_22]|uniref:Nucleoside diphosphate kinase n=1 Tax=candidate division Kazan bacterium GW2011_GWA1_44_22 TaxID=1620410 RepID=A0A0G1HYA6_UNCK3|nr:MAG: Nucleoside-diphosphate kinase [candidate division Kazan bacterium GW2011_GWA1_44_22]